MHNVQRRRGAAPFRIAMIALAAGFMAGVPASAQLNQPLHTDGWILAAARAPGLHGSIWRTDLWIVADASDQSIAFTFCKAGEDGGNAEPQVFTMTSGDRVAYIEDVVGHFLDVGSSSWVGAIHYTAPVPVQVWARVYSISADGTASYGQLVEGIPTTDMSPDDDPWDFRQQQYIIAAKHTADDRYRVNIGVVNPTGLVADYDLIAYGSDFNCPPSNCARDAVRVPPYSMVQLSDPFGSWQGGEWSAANIVIRCTTDGAGGFAYASVVDNATNDAFFVRAVKLMAADR